MVMRDHAAISTHGAESRKLLLFCVMKTQDWPEAQTARIGQALRQLRKDQHRSAQQVADRTKELGYEITRTAIADLEIGRRKHVTIAELLILAAAVEVSPRSLLFPGEPDELVEMLPGQWVPTLQAIAGFGGDDLGSIDRQLDGLTEQVGRIRRAITMTSEGTLSATIGAVQPKADDAR